MQTYGKATYNFAYRLTGNEPDARDLTQEAFIRVYRAWRSFRPGTSFLSWIYRIVTNLHRDELRRRKGRFQDEIPEDNAPQGLRRPTAARGRPPSMTTSNPSSASRCLAPSKGYPPNSAK